MRVPMGSRVVSSCALVWCPNIEMAEGTIKFSHNFYLALTTQMKTRAKLSAKPCDRPDAWPSCR